MTASVSGTRSMAISASMTVYGHNEDASGRRTVWVSNRDAKPKTGTLGTAAKHVKVEIHEFRGETYEGVKSKRVDW